MLERLFQWDTFWENSALSNKKSSPSYPPRASHGKIGPPNVPKQGSWRFVVSLRDAGALNWKWKAVRKLFITMFGVNNHSMTTKTTICSFPFISLITQKTCIQISEDITRRSMSNHGTLETVTLDSTGSLEMGKETKELRKGTKITWHSKGSDCDSQHRHRIHLHSCGQAQRGYSGSS